MDSSSFFQFRQIRSFDEVLSETFRFVRVHARPLGTIVLTIGGTYLLIPMFLFAIATFSQNALFTGIASFLSFFAPSLVNTAVCCYIVFYMDEPNRPISVQEVWAASKIFLSKILLGNLLYSLGVGLGFLFFLIPGIYLSVAMVFIPVILIHERYSVMESIDHSIATVKGYWGQTFGVLAIMALLLIFISIFLSLPQMLITVFYMSMSANIGEPSMQLVLVLVNALSELGSLVGYTLLITAITFQYYNLMERKEAIGLRERVQNMAEPESRNDSSWSTE